MKSLILIISAAAALTGCATGQTEYYAAETARHNAEAARWAAMARIAETGDTATRVAAVVTMGTAGQGVSGQVTAAPRTLVDTAVQAMGMLVPALVQGYGIREQSRLGARQSDNAAAVARSTNDTFAAIAGRIQAPAASVTNNSTTTSANVSTRTSDSHAVTGSYNAATSTRSTSTSTSTSDSHNISGSYNPVTTSTRSTTTAPVTITRTDSSNQGNTTTPAAAPAQ